MRCDVMVHFIFFVFRFSILHAPCLPACLPACLPVPIPRNVWTGGMFMQAGCRDGEIHIPTMGALRPDYFGLMYARAGGMVLLSIQGLVLSIAGLQISRIYHAVPVWYPSGPAWLIIWISIVDAHPSPPPPPRLVFIDPHG